MSLFILRFNLKCNMVHHLAETNKSQHFKHDIISNPRGFCIKRQPRQSPKGLSELLF